MDWRDGLALAGMAVTLVGFGVTIYQVVKTRGAANAAREAVTATESRVTRNLVLTLIPQLGLVERELDNAVDRDDRAMILYQLGAWKLQAGQLRGLLDDRPEAGDAIRRSLQESLVLATEAKVRMNDRRSSVAASTKRVRESISTVTIETAALTAQLSSGRTQEPAR